MHSSSNAYAVMALPGSAMYKQAIENNHQLPTTYEGFFPLI